MRTPSILLLAFAVAAGAGVAGAHPNHPELGAHGHDHEHEQERPEPTAEQKKKRLERVLKRAEQRRQTLPQRRDDRRRALKKRLGRKLDDAPITAPIREELALHARRVAWLRQIRYVAATRDDFESVAAVDRILALENARHERWFRGSLAARGEAKKP